ncbi:MAG: hypothetical protein HQL06_07745 [Nitrospirae bacterium]|nr:hypothetical protein [Nitrospirota bacterium]
MIKKSLAVFLTYVLSGFRRYKFDILIVTLIASVLPAVVTRYNKTYHKPLLDDKGVAITTKQAEDKDSLMGLFEHKEVEYKNLSERNIFSPDGKYAPDAAVAAKVVKSYRLVGVLNARQRLAILKDNNDAIYIVKESDRLDNGSVLSVIKDLSIVLKDDTGEQELKIFDIKR